MVSGSPLAQVRSIADKLADAGTAISCFLLVAITAYTLLKSLLRSAFNTSTYVLTEIVGYCLAPMATLAIARTMRSGMLIRVNLVTALLRPKAQRMAELV